MPPLKKRSTSVKEEKTTEEQRIQYVINSNYYCMIPHTNAQYATIINPITSKDHRFKTDSEEFLEMLWQLAQKGMKEKIMKDLVKFSELYDSSWSKVIELVTGYFYGKENASVN